MTSEGACRKAVIAVYAAVGINCIWPGTVSIGTLEPVEGLDDNRWDIPIVSGREVIPLENLEEHLRATIR